MESTGAPRRLRVAVADDTSDMRLLVRMALADRPELELVGEAENGQEAIDLVAALRPDLLLLDIHMPIVDGLEALPRLRQVSPDTRVVMLSALSAAQHSATALAAGAAAFVQKDVGIRELVDEVLRGADLLDVVTASLSESMNKAFSRALTSPAESRLFVAAALSSWQEQRLVDTVQLLMSELVTNVIVHTTGAPDVRVSLFPDYLHVEVADSDPAPVTPRHPSSDAVSGRGLQLVEALASAWGMVQLDRGKVVWFDVPR